MRCWPKGWLMFVAFCALGGTLAALGTGLYLAGARWFLVVLLLIGAAGFLGAGLVRLDVHADLHVGFVALSFGAIALSMYVLPSASELFHSAKQKVVSRTLAVGLALTVALGSGPLPAGIGQRLSTILLILWAIWVGLRLAAAK